MPPTFNRNINHQNYYDYEKTEFIDDLGKACGSRIGIGGNGITRM